MRRASGIGASSTRDICIFCATRRLTTADSISSPSLTLPQRRLLNSSSKAPQYAAEAQLYKDEERRPAPIMSQAERMKLLLQQRRPPPAPIRSTAPVPLRSTAQAPLRSTTPAQHTIGRQTVTSDRAKVVGQGFAGSRQPSQRGDLSIFSRPGRTQNNQSPRGNYNDRFRDTSRIRYNVNMNTPPPTGGVASFGLDNLKSRNVFPTPTVKDPIHQNSGDVSPRTQLPKAPPARSFNQDELNKLLQASSNIKGRAPPRLSQETGVRKCFNCGAGGHESLDCPKMLHNRAIPTSNPSQSEDLPSRQRASQHVFAEQEQIYQKSKNIVNPEEIDAKRRARFGEDATPANARNQYEEPRRRRRADMEQQSGRRRMVNSREENESFEREERRRLREARKEAKAKKLAKKDTAQIFLPEYISVTKLSTMLKQRLDDFVKTLEELGFEDVQHDHILNAEHAGLIAQEYNFEPIFQGDGSDGDLHPAPALSPAEYAKLPSRPPVVTIMGHVDHGKTTILDYIRKSNVAAGEFGGITQHIGAFSVSLGSGRNITFLDTPGHAAFETMRARGANVTDIVVLVVAADDSVMPQTVEAIKHAQAAKVPIIVAINKVDKQHADPEKVKLDLGGHGIEVEDFGGDVQTVLISGKTGQGISDLEEAIALQSEILDHRADPVATVEGWVLEATTKKSGRVASVLVRKGTLRQGDSLVAGNTWARVKTLRNEDGVVVEEAGPGMPVEVDGWREQPTAGDEVLQAEDEQKASDVAKLRTEKLEREQLSKDMEAINQSRRLEAERREAAEAATLAAAKGEVEPEEEVETTQKEAGPELVNFIVKGDVSGSVEAVIDSISAIGNNEVGLRVLRHGVGCPSEFDVQHAADATGHIVNFNTVIPPNIAALAEAKGVKILDSNIIYRVTETVKELLSQKLSPKITQKVTGEVEVAAIFDINLGGRKKLKIAGSKVRNGLVVKGSRAKVLRHNTVVFDGTITSLKSVKKDVEQMRKDTECGIAFNNFEDFLVGDKVQCYEEISEKRSL